MILLLGGTSDTVPIATGLARGGYRVLVSLATDVPLETGACAHPNIEVRTGPLDLDGLISLIRERGILLVVDATHPYAASIRAAAHRAARQMQIPYLTYIRPASTPDAKDIVFAADHEEAARIAFAHGKPVFLTTGARNLAPYARAAASSNVPLVVRVLPHPDSLRACAAWGIPEENIITGRGPFSLEENRKIIRQFQIGVLVTKDSGAAGGVTAKIEAARQEGCLIIVVKRPAISQEGAFENISALLDYIETLQTIR
ncbi:MAG: Precorrin-6A reductase [Syntrophaceae bacterium PtaU1.Bin231]|nr:MAG: Precorrin-6A reductase [Syntrophaceae bacterium PtaU1.Bin231]